MKLSITTDVGNLCETEQTSGFQDIYNIPIIYDDSRLGTDILFETSLKLHAVLRI